MLRELNVVEQRYRAVLEVLSGIPVVEVSERYGVARQTVHRWLARYRADGIDGLADRSHAPKAHPWRLAADVEAVICELRRAHRRWGPRRLVFELDRRGYPAVSRSTAYRVLVRYQLLEPVSRRKRRDQYIRWERPVPMDLWQLDVTASLFLADGRECKVITGIDDHSRFCVIAAVILRATGRAVCRAFITAMQAYGVPAEVLSDNGKQFTGRFGRPRPAEVLFEKICRENGITQRLTRPRSPTTTGKIERLHQTLQDELLTVHPPFATIADAQAAVDAWRQDYNATRPHQSLNMTFPAARFTPGPADALGLRIPAELRQTVSAPSGDEPPAAGTSDPGNDQAPALPAQAAETDRIVPPSGNLWIAGQQIWLGPALSGRTVQVHAGPDQVRVLLDGYPIKTLPSRLDRTDIARLLASGARPARQQPATAAAGTVIELERTVNASGNVSLGGHVVSVGMPLTGQRITVRLDGPVAHILSGGILTRTVACPVPEQARHRLRGARPGQPGPVQLPEPQTVRRRVSSRGTIMIGGQRIQVGLPHAGQTADITLEPGTYQITVGDSVAITAARTSSRDIRRHKASHYPHPQPGPRSTLSL